MKAGVVVSRVVERCRPYQVRMTCGHIEIRMMREATAGVEWSQDVIVEAGAPCMACWAIERPHSPEEVLRRG